MDALISWCNTNQGFIMVILTFVYVIATIIICVFNYRSAKATREQVAEQKREFDETNRPVVNAVFAIVRSGMACIEFSNSGTKVAENISVKINEDFLDLLDESAKKALDNINHSTFRIGINQRWYIFIGSHLQLKRLAEKPLIIDISYSDENRNYQEKTIIDLNSYLGSLIYESPEEDSRVYLKSLSETMKSIEKKVEK